MGRTIICVEGQYAEWSTVMDRPATVGMAREQMLEHLRQHYGATGERNHLNRIKRATATGTSARHHVDLEQLLAGNRAGYQERRLSREKLVQVYFVEKRAPTLADGGEDYNSQLEHSDD